MHCIKHRSGSPGWRQFSEFYQWTAEVTFCHFQGSGRGPKCRAGAVYARVANRKCWSGILSFLNSPDVVAGHRSPGKSRFLKSTKFLRKPIARALGIVVIQISVAVFALHGNLTLLSRHRSFRWCLRMALGYLSHLPAYADTAGVPPAFHIRL